MAWRVTEADVRSLVETDGTLDVAPFIDAATSLTDYVSSQDSGGILNTALLTQIEKFLSAHFYAHRDQLYQSVSTGRSSGSFQGQTAMGLRSTQYGQAAIDLDVTGCLSSLGKRKVGVAWLGLPPSEQTDYPDRD